MENKVLESKKNKKQSVIKSSIFYEYRFEITIPTLMLITISLHHIIPDTFQQRALLLTAFVLITAIVAFFWFHRFLKMINDETRSAREMFNKNFFQK